MNCPICHNQDTKLFTKLYGIEYFKCYFCKHIFQTNKLSFFKEDTYDKSYITSRGHDIIGSSILKAKMKTAVHYLSLIDRFISDKQNRNILEIGCSTGFNLKVAQDLNWNVYGLDVNAEALKICRNLLGRNSKLMDTFDSSELKNNFFSLVLMFDTIEHISNPADVIKNIEPLLIKQGLLFLITPDANSLTCKLLKNRWPHLLSEHINIYSSKSIEILLHSINFKIIKTGWAIKYLSFDSIARHAFIHSNSILSNFIMGLSGWSFLKNLIMPFNFGEMYVMAKKICDGD